MMFERSRLFRLHPSGAPGLACDARGVSLGGIPLVSINTGADGARRYRTKPADEVARVLALAYGPQSSEITLRCHRGLCRVADCLEAGDLATAGFRALALRFPTIDGAGMAKLASFALRKGGDAWRDEPRVPAGSSAGGQWTSGGASGTPSRDRAASYRQRGGVAGATITSRIRQSRERNTNGFYANSAGGGVFYIPSVFDSQQVRPTEVHVLDADAFRVDWDNGVIRLKDGKGRIMAVSSAADALARFNATTGRMMGVSIYTFPHTRLGTPTEPPTDAERREFDRESAAWATGTRASIASPSGQVTTAAGIVVTSLPLLVALGEGLAGPPTIAPVALRLNQRIYGTALARRLGAEGELKLGLSGPKEAIRTLAGKLRIPDELSYELRRLSEVKNAAKVSLTKQLRDFIEYTREQEYEFYLYVRKGAKLSKPMKDAIDRGEIILRFIERAR